MSYILTESIVNTILNSLEDLQMDESLEAMQLPAYEEAFNFWYHLTEERFKERRKKNSPTEKRIDRIFKSYLEKIKPMLDTMPIQLSNRVKQDIFFALQGDVYSISTPYTRWLWEYGEQQKFPAPENLPKPPNQWSECGLVRPRWFTEERVEEIVWDLQYHPERVEALCDDWRSDEFQEERAETVSYMWDIGRRYDEEADLLFEKAERVVERSVRYAMQDCSEEFSLKSWGAMVERRLKLLARAELLGEWPTFVREEAEKFAAPLWKPIDRDLANERFELWEMKDTYRKENARPVCVVKYRARAGEKVTATRLGGADAPMRPEEEWPMGLSGGPMEFIASFNLLDAPWRPESLSNVAFLTLFIDGIEFLPWDGDSSAVTEKRFHVKTYPNLEGLELRPKPTDNDGDGKGGNKANSEDDDWAKIYPRNPVEGYWEPLTQDYPDNHTLKIFDIFRTKLGGYPSEIQFPIECDEEETFMIQIISEENAGLNWIDTGVVYLIYHEEKKIWRLDCQFY